MGDNMQQTDDKDLTGQQVTDEEQEDMQRMMADGDGDESEDDAED